MGTAHDQQVREEIEENVAGNPRAMHHLHMDELLEQFAKICHEELNEAMNCGGIDLDNYNPKEFVLAKIILTIVGKNKHFAPPKNSQADKDMKNLEYFIG